MEYQSCSGVCMSMSFFQRLVFTTTLVLLLSSVTSEEPTTKILKRNVFLRRQKRYLTFPPGSNFVITLSAVKSLLRVQPTGWNILEEVDVPFALPSDTMLFKRIGRRDRERREIHDQIGQTLDKFGFNGTACVNRMICESQKFIPLRGSSLVKYILSAVFRHTEESFDPKPNCDDHIFEDCSVSILSYLMGSLQTDST
ncbi:unnamed protein product [Acanthoscelides obtectus]|uniref:Uncharacterized protein n=1 Tax=Acanthoscelides obtectus TaxID=200917 RepID=A0A9P0KIL4_ACAOB|nr:unnamed protein product [Acanthoscelides obtectus]CAK1664784.1 hypothetical protein AOBTE_LOCUS24461 [Acanthoscelides obtectus]